MVAGDELYEVAAAAMAPPVAGFSSMLSDLEYGAGMNYEGDESSPGPTVFYVHTEQPIAPIQGTKLAIEMANDAVPSDAAQQLAVEIPTLFCRCARERSRQLNDRVWVRHFKKFIIYRAGRL